MADKETIIGGLSCDNCPEAQRCQEQQTKKEYAINQVLQEIPSEYANIIDRLKQIIPSITRCDYVLEKQLKAKEQECQELHNKYERALDKIGKYLDAQQKYFDGEDYHNLLDIINKTKGEINEES